MPRLVRLFFNYAIPYVVQEIKISAVERPEFLGSKHIDIVSEPIFQNQIRMSHPVEKHIVFRMPVSTASLHPSECATIILDPKSVLEPF